MKRTLWIIIPVLLWLIWIANAQQINGELNSGNIQSICPDPNITTQCNLTNQLITNISLDTFSWYNNLKELYLWWNNLLSLDANIFSWLSNLNYLGLDNDQLTNLDANVFSGLTNLNYLNLVNNKISSLDPNIFSWLNNLQNLYLRNNQLKYIDPNIFSWLINLNYLYLDNNQLKSLDTNIFSTQPVWWNIYLDYNCIENTDPNYYNTQATINFWTQDRNKCKVLDTYITWTILTSPTPISWDKVKIKYEYWLTWDTNSDQTSIYFNIQWLTWVSIDWWNLTWINYNYLNLQDSWDYTTWWITQNFILSSWSSWEIIIEWIYDWEQWFINTNLQINWQNNQWIYDKNRENNDSLIQIYPEYINFANLSVKKCLWDNVDCIIYFEPAPYYIIQNISTNTIHQAPVISTGQIFTVWMKNIWIQTSTWTTLIDNIPDWNCLSNLQIVYQNWAWYITKNSILSWNRYFDYSLDNSQTWNYFTWTDEICWITQVRYIPKQIISWDENWQPLEYSEYWNLYSWLWNWMSFQYTLRSESNNCQVNQTNTAIATWYSFEPYTSTKILSPKNQINSLSQLNYSSSSLASKILSPTSETKYLYIWLPWWPDWTDFNLENNTASVTFSNPQNSLVISWENISWSYLSWSDITYKIYFSNPSPNTITNAILTLTYSPNFSWSSVNYNWENYSTWFVIELGSIISGWTWEVIFSWKLLWVSWDNIINTIYASQDPYVCNSNLATAFSIIENPIVSSSSSSSSASIIYWWWSYPTYISSSSSSNKSISSSSLSSLSSLSSSTSSISSYSSTVNNNSNNTSNSNNSNTINRTQLLNTLRENRLKKLSSNWINNNSNVVNWVEINTNNTKLVLPAKLWDTWTPLAEKWVRIFQNSLVQTSDMLSIPKISLETASRNLSDWTKYLPQADRNKDGYIIIPTAWIVVPTVNTTNITEINNVLNWWTLDIRPYLAQWALFYPWTANIRSLTWNSVYAAHSSFWRNNIWNYKTSFKYLPEVDLWEQVWVYIKQADWSYKQDIYEVIESYETQADNTSPLLETKDSRTLTLFTCTPIWTNKNRWIVRSKLIN